MIRARVWALKERLTERLQMTTVLLDGVPVASMPNARPGLADRYDELRADLSRAELAGEVSEFWALNGQAMLAVAERSAFASDYLEMAEAVASSPHERAAVAEVRTAHDLLQGNPFDAAERCIAVLDHTCHTEGLWLNLFIALHRLGELETIDAALDSFTRLDGACTARIVSLLSSEPELREVRARPAYRRLLARTG